MEEPMRQGFPTDRLHARRDVLKSIAALGVSSVLPSGSAIAQPATAKPLRIDVHHHFYPPVLVDAWKDAAAKGGPPVFPLITNWSTARTLEQLDQAGVATAVLSQSSPFNLKIDAEANRRMHTAVNEYGAKMRDDHKGRFGLFAF